MDGPIEGVERLIAVTGLEGMCWSGVSGAPAR